LSFPVVPGKGINKITKIYYINTSISTEAEQVRVTLSTPPATTGESENTESDTVEVEL